MKNLSRLMFALLLVIGFSNVNAQDENNPKGLHGERVNAVFLDKAQTLWLGTSEGLERVDWETKEFTLFIPYAEDPTLVSANNVRDIAQDIDGTFWPG